MRRCEQVNVTEIRPLTKLGGGGGLDLVKMSDVRALIDFLGRNEETSETNTVRAMQRLFSLCRSKTGGHLANQAAAANAGGVQALLRLVDTGSMRQRTWAFNTLGRLCFDHAENAAEVCRSNAIEASVANVLGCESVQVAVDVSLALISHSHAHVMDKSAYLLGNLAARPASHTRLIEGGAAVAAVAVLDALNMAREQKIPSHEIHAAFVARSVGLLTNLSSHGPSRAAVRAAGALAALERVAREGHDKHRPASAAIAIANLCSDSDILVGIPSLDAMPEFVLDNVVRALSSAVNREKYMGNVYYTPWKVAMGIRNLAVMHPLNLKGLSGAIRPLIDGLSFDELSRHHCSLALYEICVGNPNSERHLAQDFSPGVQGRTVRRVISPLIAATQNLAWASTLRADGITDDGNSTYLLSQDLVGMVAERVTSLRVADRVVDIELRRRLKLYARGRMSSHGKPGWHDQPGVHNSLLASQDVDESDTEGSEEEV